MLPRHRHQPYHIPVGIHAEEAIEIFFPPSIIVRVCAAKAHTASVFWYVGKIKPLHKRPCFGCGGRTRTHANSVMSRMATVPRVRGRHQLKRLPCSESTIKLNHGQQHFNNKMKSLMVFPILADNRQMCGHVLRQREVGCMQIYQRQNKAKMRLRHYRRRRRCFR